MERGKCKLCNRDKELCKSHIIPSSFFRDLGRRQPVVIELEPSYAKKGQNEYKEPLLCRGCENKIKVYEDYVRALILTPDKIGIRINDTLSCRYFTGIDYPKLKLFQLSLLWRASVAVHERYSPVQLNARRNEALRKMLYHEKPCNPALYGCRMQVLYNDKDEEIEPAEIILFPCKWGVKNPSARLPMTYCFIFGGYSWDFYVPNIKVSSSEAAKHIVTKEGTMCAPKLSIWKHPYMVEHFNRMPITKLSKKLEQMYRNTC